MAALKRFIAEMEAKAKGFERIQVAYNDSDANGIPRVKAFNGRWIFPPSKPYDIRAEGLDDNLNRVAVAITPKDAVVVFRWWEDANSRWAYKFDVYPSLTEAAGVSSVSEAVRSAIEKIGVPVEELDI